MTHDSAGCCGMSPKVPLVLSGLWPRPSRSCPHPIGMCICSTRKSSFVPRLTVETVPFDRSTPCGLRNSWCSRVVIYIRKLHATIRDSTQSHRRYHDTHRVIACTRRPRPWSGVTECGCRHDAQARTMVSPRHKECCTIKVN